MEAKKVHESIALPSLRHEVTVKNQGFRVEMSCLGGAEDVNRMGGKL